jgi:hypothetical protein
MCSNVSHACNICIVVGVGECRPDHALVRQRLDLAGRHPQQLAVHIFIVLAIAERTTVQAADVRHEIDYRVWGDVKFPDGQSYILGVIAHKTTTIKLPELLTHRIVRCANVMGSEEGLGQLPESAVVSGLGCGNSPAFSGVRGGDVVPGIGSGGSGRLLAAQNIRPNVPRGTPRPRLHSLRGAAAIRVEPRRRHGTRPRVPGTVPLCPSDKTLPPWHRSPTW